MSITTPIPDEIKLYLEATEASSTRVRQVMIVMITVTVIVFTAMWNASEWSSWGLLREKIFVNVEEWLKLSDDRHKEIEQKYNNKLANDEEKKEYLKYEIARNFVKNDPDISYEDAKNIAEKWQDFKINNISVLHLPFFGIVIDVNDVLIIGGFSIWVVFLWLRLSLWRHYSNLYSTFLQAKDKGLLEICFRYLSMQQVLSIPPPVGCY